MKVLVCITGASGLEIAERLVKALNESEQEVYLIITDGARKLARSEGFSLERIESLADKVFEEKQMDASISSSSNFPDAVIVVPASMKTVAKIANGIQSNLVVRAANNALRLGRRLVICPRETPVSAIDLENLARIARAGGIVLPLNIAFYFKPKRLEDVIDFLVGKILDVLGIENQLYKRWG